MRFLRFLCNFLMMIALTIGISITQVGLYNITASQSPKIDGIHLSASDETEIAYFDNYTFWVEDIGENLKQEAKHRITNWASWGWWKKGMRWADVALDTTIAVVKPIVVPVAQVNAIYNYYDMDVNDFEKDILSWYADDNMTEAQVQQKANDALYEVYVIHGKGYGEAYTVGAERKPIAEHNYQGGTVIEDEPYVEYARWVKRNSRLYNLIWRLTKYNSETYDKYFKKFISYDEFILEDGSVEYVNRNIKTPVTVMYYQQAVSIILAILFVVKYPIALGQARVVGRKRRKDLETL